MTDAVSRLAATASHVVAVGTCAAFGGIPSAFCDTSVKGVGEYLGRTVVNVPGCPPHPDWVIGTLAAALTGTLPQLDSHNRPVAFYTPEPIHERCPRQDSEEASDFGQKGLCLKELGCRGPSSHADCDRRHWNNNQNWCIGANALCIGCTEPFFPAFPLHRSGEADGGGDDGIDDDAISGAVQCVPASAGTNQPHRVYLPFAARGGQ
jgi:hydrogenase small subunit